MINSNSGFVALTSVLIISAIIAVTATGITYLTIGEAQSGLAVFKGEDNLSFVEGCVEDVLLKIRSNSAYSGTNITRPEGTCTVTYNAGGGGPTNWDITVSSLSTKYQRKINVVFVRNTTGITLTSWKEI